MNANLNGAWLDGVVGAWVKVMDTALVSPDATLMRTAADMAGGRLVRIEMETVYSEAQDDYVPIRRFFVQFPSRRVSVRFYIGSRIDHVHVRDIAADLRKAGRNDR